MSSGTRQRRGREPAAPAALAARERADADSRSRDVGRRPIPPDRGVSSRRPDRDFHTRFPGSSRFYRAYRRFSSGRGPITTGQAPAKAGGAASLSRRELGLRISARFPQWRFAAVSRSLTVTAPVSPARSVMYDGVPGRRSQIPVFHTRLPSVDLGVCEVAVVGGTLVGLLCRHRRVCPTELPFDCRCAGVTCRDLRRRGHSHAAHAPVLPGISPIVNAPTRTQSRRAPRSNRARRQTPIVKHLE